ncbi:MAG: AgmX/PglI C-terminal domain-containing protein [Gammaproteobacteria bacterium]
MYQYTAEPLLPWSDTDNDQRFNKVAKKVFIIFVILFVVIPLLPTPEVKKDKFDEIPPRFARLLIKQPIKPIIKKPQPKKIDKKKKVVKKKPKKKPKKKAVKKKKPKPKPKPSAKKVAQSAFDSAGFDELADLRDGFNVAALKNTKLKVTKKRNVKFDTSSVLKSNANSSSGGIASSKAVINSNTKLKSRSTTNVQSSIATSNSNSQRTRTTGWSDEEIQLIFQRNKGAINSIYNRALRRDPGLQGTILLKITLNASGKVIKISIVSSELKNKSIEKRIKLRVKRFNFGAKPGASNFTFNFPLVLLPQ